MEPEGSLSCSQQPNTITSLTEDEKKLNQMVANILPVSSVHRVHFVKAISKYLTFAMCSYPVSDFLLHFISEKWTHART